MSYVAYTVIPTLPDGDVLQDVKFFWSACFADWMGGYADYPIQQCDREPGWFVILADAFEQYYFPSHRRVLAQAVRWMTKHGFAARLFTTKLCSTTRHARGVTDGTPVLAVGFMPNDNRAKLYHALCFARLFTSEFFWKRKPIKTLSLRKLVGDSLRGDARCPGHLPFVDRYTEFSWERGKVYPPIDEKFGEVYFDYLEHEYRTSPWGSYTTKTVCSGDYGWTGGLRYAKWKAFYAANTEGK